MKKIICIFALVICVCGTWYIFSSNVKTVLSDTYLIFNLSDKTCDSAAKREALCNVLSAETGGADLTGVEFTLYSSSREQTALYGKIKAKVVAAGGYVEINVVSSTQLFDMRGAGKLPMYAVSAPPEGLATKEFWSMWYSVNSGFFGTGAMDAAFDKLYLRSDFTGLKSYVLEKCYMLGVPENSNKT